MNYSNGVPIGRAQGLMQVMPSHFGIHIGNDGELAEIDRSFCQHPPRNLAKSAEILSGNCFRYGTWEMAVSAYFGFGVDAMGASTSQYLAAVMALRRLFV